LAHDQAFEGTDILPDVDWNRKELMQVAPKALRRASTEAYRVEWVAHADGAWKIQEDYVYAIVETVKTSTRAINK
jgi:hypothetical protein